MSGLELLKEFIETEKPVYLSKDENKLVFDEKEEISSQQEVQLAVRGGKRKITLNLLSVWYYLKYIKDPTAYQELSKQGINVLTFRDQIHVKRYFFGKEKTIELSPTLFEKPKNKRPRTSSFDDLSNLEYTQPKKRRKFSSEENEAKLEFANFIDSFSVENEKKFEDFEFQVDTFVPFFKTDDMKNSALKGISSDMYSTKMLMRGGSYNDFSELGVCLDLVADIKKEQEMIKKRRRKKKRRSESRERSRKNDIVIPGIGEGLGTVKRDNTKIRRPPKSGSSSRRKSSSSSNKKIGSYTVKRREPIIIVPSQITSVLTIFNSQAFLENGYFQTTEDCKKKNPVRKKCVRIVHVNRSNKSTIYRVFDNVKYVKGNEWNQVVAIFTNGKLYEFRKFPERYKDKPTTLFSKIKGFHLCYSKTELDQNVRKWPITILTIDKNSRYNDKSAVASFWKAVDS